MARPPRADLRRATVVLAALALAGPALAAEVRPAGGGALRIAADPPRLLLGRDGAAELRIAAPPDLEELSLSTNAGRVEDVRRLPGGGFAARYRPPPGRVPQVAIVAARGRVPAGARDGFVAIPLSAQVEVRVRATPGASVALRIGDESFGPRTVGEDGRLVLPAIVPPGVREAHHGFRPFDLRVPETSLLHAVLERSEVSADRAERVRVLAYVVAPHGAARRGDVPAFEATRGSVSAVEREPGRIEAIWTLPPGRAGEERLLVRLGGTTASRAVLRLEARAGPPAAVALAFDRDALVAGAEPVAVVARALDAAGNPVAARLELGADGGELVELREERDAIHGRLRIGAFGPRREVRVTAAAPDAGLSASRALPLEPGEPALARLASRRILTADGSRVARLRLAIADRHGNATSHVPAVSADTGRVLSVSADGSGEHEVAYLAPAVTTPTPARLLVSAGSLRTSAERILVPPEPARALVLSSGLVRDVRGRFAAPRTALAAEARSGIELPLLGAELAWRVEGALVGTPDGPTGTILGGASAACFLSPTVVLRGSAAGGAILGESLAGPAARVGVEVARAARPLAPFVEASLLAAGRGAPGAFAAATLSVGARLGVEGRRHGHDPHRR